MQSDLPLVSIVTPVLNRASTIRACLASVASQTYPRIEHIVVDGGSTDGTLDILKRYAQEHGIRWISEPDKGMYDAINKGLKLATGQVLGYLNSDDLYLPYSVEVAVGSLQQGSDLIFGDLGILPKGPNTRGFHIQFYRPFDLSYYTHVASIGQPTVFWNRDLTERIGHFDTSYRLIGDCEYWLRAGVSQARIRHVDELLAVQVEHDETLRATQRDLLLSEFARMRSAYASHAPAVRWPRLEALKKSIVWRWRQVQFWKEAKRREPRRWPRFIGFLRDASIEVDTVAFALFMLPERVRPTRSGWTDTESLERKLMMEIKVGEFDG